MRTYSVYRDGVLIATVKARKPSRAMLDVMGVYEWCTVQGVRGDWTVREN